MYHEAIGGGGPAILFVVTVLAFSIGLLVIPVVRQSAIAVGMVDRPDAHRKIHTRAIAVGGGVGVLLVVILALVLLALRSDTWGYRATTELVELGGLAIAAAIICAVGLLDDYRGLEGKKKLAGQTLAAIVVVATTAPVERLSLFGFSVDLGLLTFPFAIIFILAAINAVNLIDGMDGLASSIGVTIFSAIAIVGFWNEHDAEGMVALAMAGALLAFLVYNFYPASIFLGDTGSMLIGLVAGALALRVSTIGNTAPIVVPLAILTIPFFDTLVAIIRRKFTGRSIYTTDRGHIHHCFRRKGMNVRWTMSCIALLSVLAGLGAIAASVSRSDVFAIAGSVAVIGVLAGTKSFGHSELLLLFRSMKMLLVSIFLPGTKENPDHDLRVQLQGEGNWEELWDELKTTAQRLALCRVRLDVNLPAMHESYYAKWESRKIKSDDESWHTVVPLVVNDRVIGRVELSGQRSENPSFQNWLSNVGELLEMVELRVAYLVQNRATPEAAPVVLHLADAASTHAPKMASKLVDPSTMSTGT